MKIFTNPVMQRNIINIQVSWETDRQIKNSCVCVYVCDTGLLPPLKGDGKQDASIESKVSLLASTLRNSPNCLFCNHL